MVAPFTGDQGRVFGTHLRAGTDPLGIKVIHPSPTPVPLSQVACWHFFVWCRLPLPGSPREPCPVSVEGKWSSEGQTNLETCSCLRGSCWAPASRGQLGSALPRLLKNLFPPLGFLEVHRTSVLCPSFCYRGPGCQFPLRAQNGIFPLFCTCLQRRLIKGLMCANSMSGQFSACNMLKCVPTAKEATVSWTWETP